MKSLFRLLAALALVLPASMPDLAFAQFVPVPAAQASAPAQTTPSALMPAGKFYVNLTTIVKRRLGYSTQRAHLVCTESSSSSTDCDSNSRPSASACTTTFGCDFRINCSLSHASFDDPIVYPGQAGKTHLHQFFGNTNTSSATDINNMASSGNSTCAGGTLNRSGYWTPPLVYECPPGSTNGCDTTRNGNVLFGYATNTYYKMSGNNAANAANAVWLPSNMHMIAGSASSNAVLNPSIAKFSCLPNGHIYNDHFPTTADITTLGGLSQCNEVIMLVFFPQCWDGVNLDSPTHGAGAGGHVAYTTILPSDGSLACSDPAYPQLMPSLSFNIHFLIQNLADFDFLRLSSDQPRATATGPCALAQYNYCAGATAHGDVVVGWDQTSTNYIPGLTGLLTVTNSILQACDKVVGGSSHDCNDDLIGAADPAHPLNYFSLY